LNKEELIMCRAYLKKQILDIQTTIEIENAKMEIAKKN
jgi:hypothetical protein